MSVPREPIKFIGELTGYTEGVPVVVSPGICIHKVLRSDVIIDGADKVADCAHLVYGSTCCQSSRGLRYLNAASNLWHK